MTGSLLITAIIAGAGKTFLMCLLFNNDGNTVFLLPTHEAVNNVINTAKAMGKVLTGAFVISEFLTENKTYREQILSLKRYDTIFIDEIFQVKREQLRAIYQAKIEFNIKIIASAAFDQVKAI